MKSFEIEVERVTGYCSCGYKVGDKFHAAGLNTPDTAFCGGAYMVIFPMQTALHCGARLSFESNPKSKTNLACPDHGYVTFKITMLDSRN
ncbi:MAG: TIGR04076 family protein [Candidatus Delongbacteria bacterium]|nr:TIGR04076 family protein [Candidatus Delongbacteria bacterium]